MMPLAHNLLKAGHGLERLCTSTPLAKLFSFLDLVIFLLLQLCNLVTYYINQNFFILALKIPNEI